MYSIVNIVNIFSFLQKTMLYMLRTIIKVAIFPKERATSVHLQTVPSSHPIKIHVNMMAITTCIQYLPGSPIAHVFVPIRPQVRPCTMAVVFTVHAFVAVPCPCKRLHAKPTEQGPESI